MKKSNDQHWCIWIANIYDNIDEYCMGRHWTWTSLPLRVLVNFLFFATGIFILTLPFVSIGRKEQERQIEQQNRARYEDVTRMAQRIERVDRERQEPINWKYEGF